MKREREREKVKGNERKKSAVQDTQAVFQGSKYKQEKEREKRPIRRISFMEQGIIYKSRVSLDLSALA